MLINQQVAFQINSETQKEYESTYNPPNPFVFMNKPPQNQYYKDPINQGI